MYPYCAINLKESNKNTLRDFLSIVDIYNLSHMFAITNTNNSSYLRIGRFPSGPTITFKIEKYCLSSDVAKLNSNQADNKPLSKSFHHIPLIILNGFNKNIPSEFQESVKLCSVMFQSIFPPLNISELDVKLAKRAVLVNLSFESQKGHPVIEIRHYDVTIEKLSSKKTISNILNMKKTDFSGYENIADYILKQTGYTDASDNEDEGNEVKLLLNEDNQQNKSKSSEKQQGKSAFNNEKLNPGEEKQNEKVNKIKLTEIGPRMELSLHKIEEKLFKGNVTYHRIIKKSKKEIFENARILKEKKTEKKKRREEQERNVIKKEELRLSKLTEEQREEEEESRRKKERLLARKRALEVKEKKEDERQTVMNKSEIKYLANLKKGK